MILFTTLNIVPKTFCSAKVIMPLFTKVEMSQNRAIIVTQRMEVIMAERDMIVMSLGEVRRLKLIQSIDRQISQKRVSSILSLSDGQIRRLVKAVREQGDKDISKLAGQCE
jgi:hypothetical protein